LNIYVMGQNKLFYDYPPHSHDLWEILINIEGHGTAVIDGQAYEYSPGTVFCLRPGTVHSKTSAEGFMDCSILTGDCCFQNESGNLFIFQDDANQSVYTLYKLARDFPKNPTEDIYGERYIRSIIDAIQNLLSHWKEDIGKDPEVRRIQKILADHVSDMHFDLDAAIRSTPYSPNYFRKLFHEQCGCPPLRFLNELKIQLAKQLLLQHKTIMTVGEIAHRCGFEDPYYFSRIFKKISGLSPMQFYKHSKQSPAIPIPQKGTEL